VNAGLAFAPPAMFWGTPAAVPQVPEAVLSGLTDVATAVTFAVAVPVFVAAKLRLRTWPTLTDTGLPVMESAVWSDAWDWIVTLAVTVGVDTVAEVFASFPLALALNVSVPVAADEQLP